MIQRRRLVFKDVGEVVAEVNLLRRGYERQGNWSLPQVCWHLTTALNFQMRPGPWPEVTAEQAARRPILDTSLERQQLPDGINAPEPLIPPTDCGDEAIDLFLAALEKSRTFPGPFAPHRLFGKLSDEEARRLQRIHAAHHLGCLVPTVATHTSTPKH